MVPLLTDFACSRVRNRAATLHPDARVSYLRRLAVAYCLCVILTSVLAVLSIALVVYAITSSAGIGYVVLFAISCVAFIALARCFLFLFRYVSRESKNF